jgi:hypothetical protein
MTRHECASLTTTELQVAADRLRGNLRRAWQRGEAGSLTDLYDLALVTTEANLRSEHLRPYSDPNQLALPFQ